VEPDARAAGVAALNALPPRVRLINFDIDRVTSADTIEHIISRAARGEGGWVLTPNLDILRRVVTEPDTRALCERTTLRVADGMPLIWASCLQRTPLPERVTGSDLILTLTRRCAEAGLGVYLLGGDINPDGTTVADAAAARLRELFPSLIIAGAESPPYGFDKDEAFMAALAERIKAASPHVVYVAVGFPKQERVIARLRPHALGAWFLGIGISFSFVSGHVQRAPRFLQRVGLEWAHRLAQEPRRLFRRYLIDGIPFAARLLIGSAWRGLRGGETHRRDAEIAEKRMD